MAEGVFLVQLALSFIVGSFWVLLTTFLAGLPSTAAVSFFFIGLTQSTEIAAQATTVFPLSYEFTGLFLVLFYVWSWSQVFLSFNRIVVGDTRGLFKVPAGDF